MRVSQLSKLLSRVARRSAHGSGHHGSKPVNFASLRHALVVSGIGLSLLATADSHLSSTQCDARYNPKDMETLQKEISASFELPLEKEMAGVIHDSFAKGFSCASYKANLPVEDRLDVQLEDDGKVFAAVIDGHGGWQVAEYVSTNLINNVRKELAFLGDSADKNQLSAKEKFLLTAGAIQRGFARTDRDLMAQVSGAFKLGFGAVARCGSCALLVFLQDDVLHVANAGDIRAVMGKNDPSKGRDSIVGVALSQDQNAMAKAEQEKLIREHPGENDVFRCRHPDSCYVKSALQPTRAFGDFALKYSEFNGRPYVHGDRSAGRHIPAPYSPPYITAIPQVEHFKVDPDHDKFVIIGTDGVWDFLSNQEAVEIVQEQVRLGNRDQAARVLVERVLQRASENSGLSYPELLSVPPGPHRRRRHDDTTATVLFLY